MTDQCVTRIRRQGDNTAAMQNLCGLFDETLLGVIRMNLKKLAP